jgi:hypothetical protein
MKLLVQVSAFMVIALPAVRSAAVRHIVALLLYFDDYNLLPSLTLLILPLYIACFRFSNRPPLWIGRGNRGIKHLLWYR